MFLGGPLLCVLLHIPATPSMKWAKVMKKVESAAYKQDLAVLVVVACLIVALHELLADMHMYIGTLCPSMCFHLYTEEFYQLIQNIVIWCLDGVISVSKSLLVCRRLT